MTNELQTKTTVETQTIDNFGNARVRLLEAYFRAKFEGKDTNDLTLELASLGQFGAVNSMVNRKNGKIASEVTLVKSEPIVSPEGKTKTVYTINIKDLDIDAKSVMVKDTEKCKKGTELSVFRNNEIARAVKRALA